MVRHGQTRPTMVTLFVQCLVDGCFPEVAEAMMAVLRRLGLTVDYPVGPRTGAQGRAPFY